MKNIKFIILLLFGCVLIGSGIYLKLIDPEPNKDHPVLVKATDENIFNMNTTLVDYQEVKYCDGCTFETTNFQKYQRNDNMDQNITNFFTTVNTRVEELYLESVNTTGCELSGMNYYHELKPEFIIYAYENNNILSFAMFVNKTNNCNDTDETYSENLEQYFIYDKKQQKEITNDENIMEILEIDQSKLNKLVKTEINNNNKAKVLKEDYDYYKQHNMIQYYPYYSNDGKLYVSIKIDEENTSYYLVVLE